MKPPFPRTRPTHASPGAPASAGSARWKPPDGGMARGVFNWEPEAYDWKGYPMGALDRGGKPTAIMDAFLER